MYRNVFVLNRYPEVKLMLKEKLTLRTDCEESLLLRVNISWRSMTSRGNKYYGDQGKVGIEIVTLW